MITKKPKPKISRAYKKMLWRDVYIGIATVIPAIYVAYGLFHWQMIFWNNVLLGLFFAAVLLIMIMVIAELLNWKCPKCGTYMGMVLYPKFCPRCGERLR